MKIDLEKISELIDDALDEVDAALTPIILRIENQHGSDIAINVAMNVGADIMAHALGRIKNSNNREATLIGHVLNIAKNMEIVMAENAASVLIHKIRKETKA